MAKIIKEIEKPAVPEPPRTTSFYGGEKETEQMERLLKKEKAKRNKNTDRPEPDDAES